MTGRQTAVDALCKAAESLIASEGDLLSNADEIQESVGESVCQPSPAPTPVVDLNTRAVHHVHHDSLNPTHKAFLFFSYVALLSVRLITSV